MKKLNWQEKGAYLLFWADEKSIDFTPMAKEMRDFILQSAIPRAEVINPGRFTIFQGTRARVPNWEQVCQMLEAKLGCTWEDARNSFTPEQQAWIEGGPRIYGEQPPWKKG